ncbi:hypothetical protein TNIN_302441 [Trichonephila inaurata madagascariensis]|uniref:Uncharacterized protein n=1 Tax=Trichonephila inaurata madagascariensis TaxID=2747483 RepID=A0A8X6YVX8_9ARAC|nr:hypothetical protein TNIN_302441 [Trichonephila inaurata madagascariensis]
MVKNNKCNGYYAPLQQSVKLEVIPSPSIDTFSASPSSESLDPAESRPMSDHIKFDPFSDATHSITVIIPNSKHDDFDLAPSEGGLEEKDAAEYLDSAIQNIEN